MIKIEYVDMAEICELDLNKAMKNIAWHVGFVPGTDYSALPYKQVAFGVDYAIATMWGLSFVEDIADPAVRNRFHHGETLLLHYNFRGDTVYARITYERDTKKIIIKDI
jgi:hypothetical protein